MGNFEAKVRQFVKVPMKRFYAVSARLNIGRVYFRPPSFAKQRHQLEFCVTISALSIQALALLKTLKASDRIVASSPVLQHLNKQFSESICKIWFECL